MSELFSNFTKIKPKFSLIVPKIIAICNQKGGVGKTTTCVNLASGLGVLERKVLVIDTDPQAHASMSFGFNSSRLNTPALQNMDFVSVIKNNTKVTNSLNVDLLPYIEDINFFEKNVTNSRFQKALQIISKSYDYILIDCVPFFLKKNLDILISSNSVIIPIQCDYFALEGLHTFLKTINKIQKKFNPHLEIEGFLLTMFDKRLNLSKNVVKYVNDNFKSMVFKTIINRNTTISQAPSFGKTVIDYDVCSKGANDYLLLANEIINNNVQKNIKNEIPKFSESEESKFNNKIFLSKEDNDSSLQVLNKLFNRPDDTNQFDHKIHGYPKNFGVLIGIHKSEVQSKLGTNFNSFYGNVWIYKLNNRKFFDNRYLYLYFKNDIVNHFETSWFLNKKFLYD